MSHQINLYDPALLRRRQWLTAASLASASALLFVVLLAWGVWLRTQADALDKDATALANQTKAAREESTALAARLANRKPDPKVEADLAALKQLLGVREEILTALGQGAAVEPAAYAEYLRGLARQAVEGLWLTGFFVGPVGGGMEIRGRTIDPALLPEYIRRLNGEPAFRNRRFAALSVTVPAPVKPTPGRPVAAVAAAASAPETPAFHEFVLAPEIETGKTEKKR